MFVYFLKRFEKSRIIGSTLGPFSRAGEKSHNLSNFIAICEKLPKVVI